MAQLATFYHRRGFQSSSRLMAELSKWKTNHSIVCRQYSTYRQNQGQARGYGGITRPFPFVGLPLEGQHFKLEELTNAPIFVRYFSGYLIYNYRFGSGYLGNQSSQRSEILATGSPWHKGAITYFQCTTSNRLVIGWDQPITILHRV